MTEYRDKDEFYRFCEECSKQLREKRHDFMHFLQMNDEQLWQDPEFMRFLVTTTDELLECQEQLLTMAGQLDQTDQSRTGGSLVDIGRAV